MDEPSINSLGVGLTSEQARLLLEQHGPNETARRRVSHLRILLRQAQGTIFWLLVLAALVSAALGETGEAAAMAGILLLNVLVATAQELHSERSLRQLHVAAEKRARVRRDGRAVRIPASRVVPSDTLLLEPGDIVAADGVLRVSRGLLVDEAELTGALKPAAKRAANGHGESREARVLMGTVVVEGSGVAEVVATGSHTELGAVTRLSDGAEQQTPLRGQLDRVGRGLVVGCVGIVLLVAASELARGAAAGHVLLVSLSLAVASLPESLGALVTIALTAAARALSEQHVLVRRLDAVETLGRATLICVGKSGTLTTTGLIVKGMSAVDHLDLLHAALATTTTESAATDPIHRAIVKAAHDSGLDAATTSDGSLMEPVWSDEDGSCDAVHRQGAWYVRGEPERLLPRCRSASEGAEGLERGFDPAAEATTLRERGLMVLAIARGDSLSDPLECVGLLGLAELTRPETKQAIDLARRAGIRVVMMTGDREQEARAIAEEVGLAEAGSAEESELVLANTTPEQKVEHVRHWKEAGEIVAVTGDRMNDAPAVGEAHIGIAMGNPGSDVTCDAADMILLDDDFAHVISALRYGRGVFRNIRKSLTYALAGNLAELCTMLVASTLGWAEPLLPIQLLWINLVTDSLPAFALVLDPPGADVLVAPPRRPDEALLGRKQWLRIVAMGALQASLPLLAFRVVGSGGDLVRARALCQAILVFEEVFWALALGSSKGRGASSVASTLFVVVIGSALLEAGLALIPMHNSLGRALHLGPSDVALSLAIGLVPLGAMKALVLLQRRGSREVAVGSARAAARSASALLERRS